MTTQKRIVFLALFFLGGLPLTWAQNVSIRRPQESPTTQYAVRQLESALQARGYTLKNAPQAYVIDLQLQSGSLKKEAYSLAAEGNKITISGGDASGLLYGCLSLAEELKNGVQLSKVRSRSESPHLPFRAIKFDMPWDTYRHSTALDLHSETCRDVNYWKAFLDMMAQNRFNTLTLWNLHPYVWMIRPQNFPEASPFNDREMAEWQNLFRSIFRMARERGIDTYVVPFNIFVSPEFAKAHGVALDNLEHHFFVKGDTSEIIKRYTRECVTQLLEEYPDLSGMGLTLGEGMGGMTPAQREQWMRETIIEGMRRANRKSKLIHRIPFSSNVGSLGPTSVETEQLTRKSIEEEADLGFVDGPIWADLKFNWSHAHSTPQLVKVHGGKLYDTYFKPEPTAYKIVWTARNEDFFCLRWGVPDFVRQHITHNTAGYLGGYMIGSETYIPAKDYFTRPGTQVDWQYAFERQWLFYKLWGRLLYNPATSDEVFRAEFIRRYGKPAQTLLEAFSLAGRTPLRLASAFDFTWDFSLYSEGMMALDSKTKVVSYISADRLINQPPTDPDYVSVKEYVEKVLSGANFEPQQVTPPVLADMLEKDCRKALELVSHLKVPSGSALRNEIADVKAWANLGLHLAEKLKGAVALQKYRRQGGKENQQQAIGHFEKALSYWDAVIGITRPLYQDMPLVHLSEQNGKPWQENDSLRFHWKIIRPQVAQDIEIAQNATVEAQK